MRLLIIGPLSGDLTKAARLAMDRGARVQQTDVCQDAISMLRNDAGIDLVLCDVSQDVPLVVESLALERIAVPVIACGVNAAPDTVVAAIKAGAQDFLPLPPNAEIIAAILAAACNTEQVVIARDPVMQSLLRRAGQVALSDASVLITGESGTGKEVVARQIHRRSRRSEGPLVALNCAAIPEPLLESELFGHEKGAFSGAVARRIGKFEAANGGTLLLDEIGEMDVKLQTKLLRVLQEREVDRIGGNTPVKVDVRIIASTNRDLFSECASGRFRLDLYYRLNVIHLVVPPLRQRPKDIQALVDHYVRHYTQLNGLASRHITDDARDRLAAHDWPGNVRELENTVHRAVLLAEGDVIGVDAIELPMSNVGDRNPLRSSRPLGEVDRESRAFASLVGRRVEDVERDLILQTLSHTLGNRTHAATLLGISIRTLRNKLRDYAAAGLTVPRPHANPASWMSKEECI